jgi:predicted nucleic acid-binding protein
MSRIFWDTNLFVYLIEDRGALSERVATLRARMLERDDELYTSALTLGELLVKPLEAGDETLAAAYEMAVREGATVVPFDSRAALEYARIRRDRTIRAPDAIQLACAASAGIDWFVTNDDRLSKKTIRGIQFVTSLERGLV